MRLIDWALTEEKYKKNKEEIDKNNKYQKNTLSYTILGFLFIFILLLVPIIKNNTRNIENEIINLKALNNNIKFNLSQAILDSEVITTPENITKLANDYLNTKFVSYKKIQIKDLNANTNSENKSDSELSNRIKTKLSKKIREKKAEIKKLKEIYSNPKKIPSKIKNQVTKKMEKKKKQLSALYSSPKEIITVEKAQKWVAVQFVKIFLGMPIVPGR